MSARYQLLRRTFNAAREGWTQQVNALPEVASDIGTDLSALPGLGAPARNVANSGMPAPAAALPAVVPGLPQRFIAPSLGQWNRPLPRVDAIKNIPQLGLGIPSALGLDLTKGVFPNLPASSSPAAISAATLPGVSSLLKVPAASSPEDGRAAVASASGGSAAKASNEGDNAAVSGQAPQQLLPPPPPPPSQVRRPARTSASGVSSVALNKQIMACRSTEELLSLVMQRGAGFDFFNISSAIARVPKLVGVPMGPGCTYNGAAGNNGEAMHLDQAGRNLLDNLARLMCNNIHTFDARGLANSAWAFGKLKYTPSTQLPTVIAGAALTRLNEFSAQNISNLMWSFVYMHHRDPTLLGAVAEKVVSRIAEFKPQELANTVWAFASLDFRDDRMLATVAEQAGRIAHLFKEQELSNVLWAYGKLHAYYPCLIEPLMAETRSKLHAFLPQGISNVCWALACVGHNDRSFMDQVVVQCGHQLSAFDAQALANLAWAQASLGYYQPPFFAALVEECLARGLERLSPQNLSNILWSCATLGHQDPRMLAAWAQQTLDKLGAFEPQGLANSAWAFAKLGYRSPILFEALGGAALHKLDHFTAQGLSNLAWAYASTGQARPQLFEALAHRATLSAPAFNAQNCSMMLWSCATLRHYDAALFDAMLGRLVGELTACEPQNVSNAVWALARMGHPMGDTARPLVQQALALLPRMNQQELCNTMWGLAVMEALDVQSFGLFCECLARCAHEVSAEGLHQAYHAQLMFHSQLARNAGTPLTQLPSGLLPTIPEPLHTLAAALWQASARDVHVSRFHQEVSGVLSMAGLPHAVECLTDDNNFSIDIGMEVNEHGVAVEVDGSHHFTTNEPHRTLSDQVVRKRLLEDRGWSVVNVGFNDWESVGPGVGDRAGLLIGRIANAVGTWDWQSVGLPQRQTSVAPSLVPNPVLAGLHMDHGLPVLFANGAAASGQQPSAGGLSGLERACSVFTESQVEQALSAAEALQALPDGDTLLARHTFDVLGVQLPNGSHMTLPPTLQSGVLAQRQPRLDDDDVDLDGCERMVRFALADGP